MTKGELLEAIDSDHELHVAFLQEFIRAPSPNPPGNTVEAAAVVQRYLAQRHVRFETISPLAHAPNIVSEVSGAGNGPRLIMNGHIDVFPVGDGAGWAKDPWSGEISDGQIHGRGATDMKTGTAASIIAYAYLYERQTGLNGSLGLTAVSDEETGGKWGSRWLLENESRWQGDCMINAEPSGLETIRFAEKGTLRLTFTVQTDGAHGAYVHRSLSASRLSAALIGRLAEIESIVPEMPADIEAYLQRSDVRTTIDKMVGTGAADIIGKPTLNVGTIHAGLKVNMIPARCVFEADIRLPIGLDASAVLEKIGRILEDFPQASMEVQEAASNPANWCQHDHKMVDLLARNAETLTGVRPIAVPSLGATDAKFWRYRKVPSYLFGPAPGRMAATNESVPLAEFRAIIRTHALAAWDYLGGAQ